MDYAGWNFNYGCRTVLNICNSRLTNIAEPCLQQAGISRSVASNDDIRITIFEYALKVQNVKCKVGEEIETLKH